MVDAVVEAPFGAHPTSFYPNYTYDDNLHLEWTAASRDNEAAEKFISRYVQEPEDQQQYLEAVGGRETISRIENP